MNTVAEQSVGNMLVATFVVAWILGRFKLIGRTFLLLSGKKSFSEYFNK